MFLWEYFFYGPRKTLHSGEKVSFYHAMKNKGQKKFVFEPLRAKKNGFTFCFLLFMPYNYCFNAELIIGEDNAECSMP